MLTAYHFFLKHAGCGYVPGKETKSQGRIRGAKKLAADEQSARDQGFYFRWSVDESVDSSEFSDETPAWELWQCGMYNRNGRIVNSLHAIDFGRNRDPFGDPYKRVVEAELCHDGLTNTHQ